MELRYECPIDDEPPRARPHTEHNELPEPQMPMDLLVRRVDARRVPPGHERPREHANNREGDERGLLAVLDVRARVPQLKVGLLRALRVVHGRSRGELGSDRFSSFVLWCPMRQGQPSGACTVSGAVQLVIYAASAPAAKWDDGSLLGRARGRLLSNVRGCGGARTSPRTLRRDQEDRSDDAIAAHFRWNSHTVKLGRALHTTSRRCPIAHQHAVAATT